MQNNNPNQGPNGYPIILFVRAHHIEKITDKGRSTAYFHLRQMRKQFKIVRPAMVTLEKACKYFTISEEEFYSKYYGYKK